MYKRKAREFNTVELAPLLGSDTSEMQAMARRLQKLHQAKLYRELTPWQHAYEERVVLRARELAGQHGLRIFVQRQPLGWPLYVYDPTDPRLQEGRVSIEASFLTVGKAVCPW